MKRPLIRRKKTQQKKSSIPSRITNETVAEHREQILAGGRKFKYPVQYARHKLVINAILVVFVTAALLATFGWWQLYPMQNSGTFMYRVAKIVPVPVATVDGQSVPYRDYLVSYYLSKFYLNKYDEIKLDSKDGRRQLEHVKRQSLDLAEQISYSRKLASKYNVTVSNKDIDSFIDKERDTANGKTSQATYDAAIKMLFGLSTEDYRLSVENSLLRNKVAFAVDKNAAQQVIMANKLMNQNNGDFAAVAESMVGTTGGRVTAGQSGIIQLNTTKFNGLRISDISNLKQGEVSGLLKSTTDDGYYFVKLDEKTPSQVNFTYLHIPLKQFADDFAALKKSGKIREYITVKDV